MIHHSRLGNNHRHNATMDNITWLKLSIPYDSRKSLDNDILQTVTVAVMLKEEFCYVCVPMSTHCTITCFGFHARHWVWSIFCNGSSDVERRIFLCVCSNANPLHYYVLRVPRKALSVVYFWITHRLGRPHYVWDEYLYSVREKVVVRVTVSVTVCVVLLCCVEWWCCWWWWW